VFVHGSGRSGADAFPLQTAEALGLPTQYVVRAGFGKHVAPGATNFEVDALLVDSAVGDGAHVVAASYGAIAALQAAALPDSRIRSLVLVEPAAYSLGRRGSAVEAHIYSVGPVFAQARGFSPAEFQIALLRAFGVDDPQEPTTPDELLTAERLRLQRPPWEAKLDPSLISQIPTLVVTGNWNAEYEELAGKLVGLGASHRQLPGYGHGVQHSPDFNALLRDFWSTLS
jgi:pimeloyl-ACP methyl ester carboxylesterase